MSLKASNLNLEVSPFPGIFMSFFSELNLHRGKQAQATGFSKVKHKWYFIYALHKSHSPPSVFFVSPPWGAMAALPQKAHMFRLRGAGAAGGARQPRGRPDRATNGHMQSSSGAAKYTFPAHLLDLQVQEMRSDGQKTLLLFWLSRLLWIRVWQKDALKVHIFI